MKKLYAAIALLAVSLAFPAQGQAVTGIRNVEYTGRIVPRGDHYRIDVTIDPSRLRMSGQEMITFTPVLVSTQDKEEKRFSPVVFAGGRRMKAVNREIRYGNMPFEAKPEVFVRNRNGRNEVVVLRYDVPCEEWMRGADLVMLSELSGCVKCDPVRDQQLIATIPIPAFRLTYIVPEAETKTVSARFTARLNYVVDKYDLLVNFKNNARVLAEVDQAISPIVNNSDFKVTYCAVDGYASPEGRYERNVLLADNRARAFVNYLAANYNWDTGIVSSEGHAEDWKGLRDTVARMHFADRDRVLDIIDNTPDIAVRKSKLHALSGGATYRNLLATVYPPLRRNEFEVTYDIRPYSVEEAREIFRTKPHLLSLNELFLVAQSYDPASAEFKDVFDTAVRMFPDSDMSKVNAGAMEIEQGTQRLAVARLRGMDMPEAWNNTGVAYATMGEYRLAAGYFARAAAAGEINGQYNLDQLKLIYDE